MTPWTVARQASPSMRFSRQECWSELPCPPPGDLPNPEIELGCLLHYRQILYQLSVQLRRPKMGRKFQKEGVCVYVWLVYLAVQNNIVEQLYSNKNLKKETKQKTLLLPTLNGKGILGNVIQLSQLLTHYKTTQGSLPQIFAKLAMCPAPCQLFFFPYLFYFHHNSTCLSVRHK